jgi:hypothetical protein
MWEVRFKIRSFFPRRNPPVTPWVEGSMVLSNSQRFPLVSSPRETSRWDKVRRRWGARRSLCDLEEKKSLVSDEIRTVISGLFSCQHSH